MLRLPFSETPGLTTCSSASGMAQRRVRWRASMPCWPRMPPKRRPLLKQPFKGFKRKITPTLKHYNGDVTKF